MAGYGGKHLAFLERNLRDDLARRERLAAEPIRRAAEARSGRGEGRSALGLMLARLSASDAAASRSAEGALDALRVLAQGRMRKAAERPGFFHQDDARDDGTAPGDQARPAARRVENAGGSLRSGDPRASDHWSSGGIFDAMEALSPQDMAHISLMRLRNRFF